VLGAVQGATRRLRRCRCRGTLDRACARRYG